MNRTRLLAIVCFCVGCGTAEPAALGEPALSAPIEEGELVLDERADGARLIGRLEPVPPDGDPDRVLVLRVVPSIDPALEGARVTDARFVGDAIVTVGADHVLRVHAAQQLAVLDAEVYEPLSVAGTSVAYVRGEPPFLEVARADVQTGVAEIVTRDMAPAWSPALTPDGRAIVFVSGAEGSPRLYRIEGSDAPRALAQTARTPSSPFAPRFEGELLVFDDEAGRAWLDLESGRVVRTAEVAR